MVVPKGAGELGFTATRRAYLAVSAGSVFVFTNGIQAFANLQTMLEHDYYSNVLFSAGFRLEL